jgi:hypothetical protein
MRAQILEGHFRSSAQVADGTAGQHLTGRGQPGDAGADVDGHSAPFVTAAFAFADMNACTDWNAPKGKSTDKFQRAANCVSWALEQCEDAVACVVRAPPAVSGQQAVDDVVVDIQLMTPMCVAVADSISVDPTMSVNRMVRNARSSADAFGLPETKPMTSAITRSRMSFTEWGPGGRARNCPPGDCGGHRSGCFERDHLIAWPREHESRCADGSEQVADV